MKIELLEKALEREKKARQEAENLLKKKSLELDDANIKLQAQNTGITLFPEENPNPVMQYSGLKYDLIYANKHGLETSLFLNKSSSRKAKKLFIRELIFSFENKTPKQFDMALENKTMRFYIVPVPLKNCINIYGNDITDVKEAEDRLRNITSKLIQAQQLARIGSWEVDIASNHMLLSEESLNILQVDQKKFIPTYDNYINLLHPDDKQVSSDSFNNAIKENKDFVILQRRILDNGESIYLECRGKIDSAKDGEVRRLYGILIDVSEKVTAQQAKEKYSNIVHATNDLISTIDNTGTILFVNDSWLQKMGYREDEVIGNSIFKHVHPDSQEHCVLFFQDLMSNSPEQLDVNYSLINRHGEKIEIEGTIVCKYEQNQFFEGNSFLTDVTEINNLRRIEEEKAKEILKVKEKLETVMDSLTETVWGVRLPDYKSEYISNSALDLYGIPHERWINNPNTWLEAVHPDDLERVESESAGLFLDGFTELEYRIVTPKNEVKWIQTRTKIVKNADGIPYLMTGIAADITKRKKLELELIDYKKGIDSAAIVSITDEKGNIIYANDKFCEISKYSVEELIGQNHNILNSGYHSKEFFQEMWRTISSGNIWKGEVKNKAKDGSEYYVESSIIPFMKEGKAYQYLSIRYDSTEKVLNKLELETQKQFYEFILNNLPADLAVFSPDHKYLFINPAGIKNNEIRNFMIGKDDFDYCQLKGIDTKLAVERRTKFNELVRNKKFIEWEDVKIMENDAQQHILRKMGPIYDEHGDLKMVIGYGIEITERKIAEENVLKAKKEVEAINSNLKKLVSEETQKNLQLSKSLTENEKMATVGELASGIAHDLNTPLSSIRNGSEAANFTVNSILQELIWKCTREQLNFAIQRASSNNESSIFTSGLELMRLTKNFSVYLSGKFTNYPEIEIKEISSAFVRARIEINEAELIDQIMNASNFLNFLKLIENIQTYQSFVHSIEISANRALNVVNDLRLNIKNQNSIKSHVNLKENISSVLNIFNFELEQKVKIDIKIADSIVIYGYDIKLFQLWSNIIKNALEAMESNKGGKLIKISASETKDTISVAIKNNGPAIPIENQHKIFEKFYSTKRGLSSSGLGMSIVKNIIEDHAAKILLESTDLFTTFTINFKKYDK